MSGKRKGPLTANRRLRLVIDRSTEINHLKISGYTNFLIAPSQKKTQAFTTWVCVRCLAIPYFRMANCHTIIGAKRFHFRVRDGIGWFTLAMVTKQTGSVGLATHLQTGSRSARQPWKSVTSILALQKCQPVTQFSSACHPNQLGVIWSSLTGN